jgi:DNA polymerase-4/DNA polymerase V
MDGDAFFVGVEMAKDPSLKGLPVVTGQERGIVTSLSYEAKALGVTRGMTIYSVKKQFPEVIVMQGDYISYMRYSRAMFDIVRRYADDVEEYSIDECFADITGLDKPLKMSYETIAKTIQEEIEKELALSVTLGLAPTKVLAKVASKWKKPHGLTSITKATAHIFLQEFPIEKVWGIGKRTANFLMRNAIKTAHDFVSRDRRWIHKELSSNYETLWFELRGESYLHLNARSKDVYRSIGRSKTFHPVTSDVEFLMTQIAKHGEDVCRKVRKHHYKATKVSLFLRKKDLTYAKEDITLPTPIASPETLITILEQAFFRIYVSKELYRSTGVTLHHLVDDDVHQDTLFDIPSKEDKFTHINKSLDLLSQKIGKHVVYVGRSHKAQHPNDYLLDKEGEDRDLLFV